MKHAIVYARDAVRDLDRIWEEVFSSSQDYDTTALYLEELQDKIEAKRDYPQSGIPLYYRENFTGYYFVRHKAYLAFYRWNDTVMFVDRILYGKSDYMSILDI